MRAPKIQLLPSVLAFVLAVSATCACSADAQRPSGRQVGQISLWLGGDVHMGTQTAALLAPLAEHLAGAYGIVNLEGPVGPGASSREHLVNGVDSLPALVAGGVRVAGVRNNHDGDLGASGLGQTRAALRAVGILPAGADPVVPQEPSDEASGIALLERGGVRVAVTAHDLSPVSDARALGSLGVDIARDITSARARADAVVATFHVRGPPSYLPPRELEEAVEVALSSGALVVAAHGSHALARVERRGPAVIAWGLGNLLFDCECTRERDALIVRLTVRLTARSTVNSTGRPDSRQAAIEGVRIIPIDAGLLGEPARPSADAELTMELLRSLGTGRQLDETQ